MSLISKQDFIKAAGLQKFGFIKSPIASTIMGLTKLNDVNRLYDSIKHHEGVAFFDAFLKKLEIQYVAFEEDLAKIPKTGPFILVANHPLGAIDGILMCKILTEIRPDFKIMGNFLLQKIEPMKDYVIPVNPFETRKEAYSSISGMRDTLKHLQEGGCIGIFPAGEVSNRNNVFDEVLDKEWEIPALKLIKKAKVPVVPMYFHTKNSSKFYSIAKIHADLQTLLLPSEMMKKRDKPIRIRIGKPVSPKIQEEYES
ncbi:MAG: lysophospholipid acyltransferase family protein, partial [Cloacibacterium sp.]